MSDNGSPAKPRLDTLERAIIHAGRTEQTERARAGQASDLHRRKDERSSDPPFFLYTAGLAALACLSLAVTAGDGAAKLLAATGLACSAAVSGYVLWQERRGGGLPDGVIAAVSSFAVLAWYPAIDYWGVFSPAPAIIAALLSVCPGARSAFATYAVAALAQGGLAALVLSGVLPDRGLIPASAVAGSIAGGIVLQVLVQAGFVAAFRLARARSAAYDQARRETRAQIAKAAEARVVQEALLAEARFELDRVITCLGSGRYTGQVVGGYRLGDVIGRSQRGEVYDAMPADPGQPEVPGEKKSFAVKLLTAPGLEEEMIERMLAKVKGLTVVKSDHVVRVFAAGRVERGAYVAMEQLYGRDLAAMMRVQRRLSLPEVIDLVSQIGTGLADAHAAGVTHLALQPRRLILADFGWGMLAWKITGFGAAELADPEEDVRESLGGAVYLAPEQLSGGSADARSDLFSLGAIAYRALTGVPPFWGNSATAIVQQITERAPRPPSSLITVPSAVDEVMAKALAKAPEDRFANGVELAKALSTAGMGSPGAPRGE